MLVGVVCEGPTDYPAIAHFFGNALRADGINATFKSLHPRLDRTRPPGGWGNVLLWLADHGPQERIQRFFNGGLFESPAAEICDVLLIQLDTDVIAEESFQTYVLNTFGYQITPTSDAQVKANQISEILRAALRYEELCADDASRHIICPAVDATESWCVAAFDRRAIDAEQLQGAELVSAFMKALERFEGKVPKDEYANCSKDTKRRERYCDSHGRFWGRVVRSCPHFAASLFHIKANRKISSESADATAIAT
jgi:hypothetical protein